MNRYRRKNHRPKQTKFTEIDCNKKNDKNLNGLGLEKEEDDNYCQNLSQQLV